MSTVITIIVVAAVVVLALVALVTWQSRRRASLRSRFGPEYDRTVSDAPNRRTAEKDLRDRAARRDELDIRPLDPMAAERYRAEWRLVQERFVDAPAESVAQAASMVTMVMNERGYPTDDDAERDSMLSVDHADVMSSYRSGRQTEQRWRDSGTTDTEDLRQAMQHYRTVFDRLVSETDGGDPTYPSSDATPPVTARRQ